MKDISFLRKEILIKHIKTAFLFVIVGFISYPFLLRAQTLTGIPGYIRVPNAELYKDGNIFFGSSFLPKKYLEYSKHKYDAMTVYTGITFLPFLEVDFRVTRMLEFGKDRNYTVDRMPSIRLQIFKEKIILPSILIGINDIAGDARNFGALYCVITKNIQIASLSLNGSLGYGTNWFKSENYNAEYYGLFGGIRVSHKNLTNLCVLLDFDGDNFSTGVSLFVINHIRIMMAAQGLDSFCGSISYQFIMRN